MLQSAPGLVELKPFFYTLTFSLLSAFIVWLVKTISKIIVTLDKLVVAVYGDDKEGEDGLKRRVKRLEDRE